MRLQRSLTFTGKIATAIKAGLQCAVNENKSYSYSRRAGGISLVGALNTLGTLAAGNSAEEVEKHLELFSGKQPIVIPTEDGPYTPEISQGVVRAVIGVAAFGGLREGGNPRTMVGRR